MAEGNALRELLALFKLGVDEEELEKGAKHVEGFVGKLTAVGKAVAEAFAVHAVKEFFLEQVEGAAHLQDLAQRLDVSATALRQFGFVAQGAGLDLETAAHSLGFLSKNLGEAKLGNEEASKAFAALEVKVRDAHGGSRDLFDVLGDVAEGFQKLPDQQVRSAYAMKIFGREGKALLPVLAQGREAIEEQLAEARELAGGLGDDYYEQAKKAREATERFAFVMDTVKGKIAQAALPAIIGIYEKLKTFGEGIVGLTKHTYILQTGLIALAAVSGVKLLGSLAGIGKALGILKPSLAETIAALWRFAAPAVVIAAVYLVFDSLFTLMKGGKSVIGEVLDALFGLGAGAALGLFLNAVVKDSVRFFGDLARIIVDSVLLAVQATADAVYALGKALNDLVHGRFDEVGKDFTDGFKDLPKIVSAISKAGGDLVGGPSSALERLSKLNAQGIDTQTLLNMVNLPGGQALLGGAQATAYRQPESFERTGGAGTNVHQNNKFDVVVHTASDKPRAVGEAVGQGVATAAEKANNNALIAVRRQ